MKRDRVKQEEEEDTQPPQQQQLPVVVVIPRPVLEVFYRTLFSHALPAVVHGLGTCGGRFELFQREIVPQIDLPNGNSYMRRYDVYRVTSDLYHAMLGECPSTIQFGAVFPGHHLERQPVVAPKLHEMNQDVARPRDFERHTAFKTHIASPYGEMVIDVDMCSEYKRNGICACGEDRKVCDKCWSTFLNPAQQVLDLIYDYFGLTARFRVFSGRRGFHDWLINKRVIYMSAQQRHAFFEAIQWRNLVPGSDLCESIYDLLAPIFDSHPVLKHRFNKKPASPYSYKEAHRAAVFEALYPKMDKAVTVDATHLHKLPLTLHPVTGNLCVPIMGAVGSKYEFCPSNDVIPYGQLRLKPIKCGLLVIERALAIAAKDP